MDSDADRRVAVAEQAARAGALVASERFRTGLDFETKDGPTDVVTQADRDAQGTAAEVIASSFPGETIVGEEGDAEKHVPADGPVWVIDPIDGTNNYVADIPIWTTSVAAVVDGEPFGAANVAPAMDATYLVGPDGFTFNGDPAVVSERTEPEASTLAPVLWWPRDERAEYCEVACRIVDRFDDMRRFGSTQLALSFVATGALDGAINTVASDPWDTIAGVAMIREAGGTVTDVAGDRWRHDSDGLVASNGRIHDAVLEAAQEARATVRNVSDR